MRSSFLLAAIACLPAANSAGQAAVHFDDIELWAGAGANRAAVVIDWDETPGTPESLVWGYRWDGVASGATMLEAVVAADPRLFARVSAVGELGSGVYGIGYDANADAAFGLTDQTLFDQSGFAVTGSSDLAEALDADDFYTEGWRFAGFWHYATTPEGFGDWTSSQVGASFRPLSDGAWDAWVFTPTYASTAFPDAPTAAPSATDPGDFNRDGLVDAADYTVWRDANPTEPVVAGVGADGDLSGVIDAADLTVWRTHYGATPTTSPATRAIPEPGTLAMQFTCLLIFAPWIRKRFS